MLDTESAFSNHNVVIVHYIILMPYAKCILAIHVLIIS